MTSGSRVPERHPLVGDWVSQDEWESAVFSVSSTPGGFRVTGVDRDDGEEFVISDLRWDGAILRFRSLMPSTGLELLHEFRSADSDHVEHSYTRTETYVRL